MTATAATASGAVTTTTFYCFAVVCVYFKKSVSGICVFHHLWKKTLLLFYFTWENVQQEVRVAEEEEEVGATSMQTLKHGSILPNEWRKPFAIYHSASIPITFYKQLLFQ